MIYSSSFRAFGPNIDPFGTPFGTPFGRGNGIHLGHPHLEGTQYPLSPRQALSRGSQETHLGWSRPCIQRSHLRGVVRGVIQTPDRRSRFTIWDRDLRNGLNTTPKRAIWDPHLGPSTPPRGGMAPYGDPISSYMEVEAQLAPICMDT